MSKNDTGIPVKHMLFQDLDEKEVYDGIWACSSILHVPANELRDKQRLSIFLQLLSFINR